MGLAIEDSPLTPKEAERAKASVQKAAAEQCLAIWMKQKDRIEVDPLWGDEIEFPIVNLDVDLSRATMFLGQAQVIKQREAEADHPDNPGNLQWEWASYVVETTPAKPYTGRLSDLANVEDNMRKRRELINRYLPSQTYAVPLCIFPRTGVASNWTSGPSNDPLCSQPRYKLLARNVDARSNGGFKTWLPIYRDSLTIMPFLDDTILGEKRENHICLDQQNIGRGSCSIQTTFQTANEAEARWLHDQFIPLGPCLLALTAATPIWKGIMVDTDSRWQRYGDLVDDRDSNERDCLPPRWNWNQSYLSINQPPGLYNPESLKPMDLSLKKYLVNGGMDHFLADHFASILSRDPLILTEAETKNMTPTETHLFESLYGYVWNHVRFKLPISENGPGWRVEFRPMEAQLTDFDNAAFAIFSFLLSRAIVCFHLNFYIPIDLVNESGKSCQKRDAVVEERFWFRRRNWLSKPDCMDHKRSYYLQSKCQEMTGGQMYGLMSANEIINGEETIDGFPGLLFFVHCYLDHVNVSEHERNTIEPCLSLIRDRARGISPTPASWMRNFVRNHEDYCKDSHVSEKVCYDMMEAIIDGNEHNRA